MMNTCQVVKCKAILNKIFDHVFASCVEKIRESQVVITLLLCYPLMRESFRKGNILRLGSSNENVIYLVEGIVSLLPL